MSKGINYSKWDNIELSDDEDFECHPNVDKGSMVRWKQAEIYRERRERNDKLTILANEIQLNKSLLTALDNSLSTSSSFTADTDDLLQMLHRLKAKFELEDQAYVESVQQMRWADRDARWRPPEPIPICERRTRVHEYVAMITKRIVTEEAGGDSSSSSGSSTVKDKFAQGVKLVQEAVTKRRLECEEEIRREEMERDKKITSENIYKEVYDKTSVGPVKKKETVIETIHNPNATKNVVAPAADATSSASPTTTTSTTSSSLSPTMQFAALKALDVSYKFLGAHPEIVSQSHSDEILADAFRLQMEGKTAACKQTVNQALLLQYCALLGKDGVMMFFKRMETQGHQARELFYKDVEDTTNKIVERVKVLKQNQVDEEAAEKRAGQERAKSMQQEDGSYRLPVHEDSPEEDKKRADVFAGFPRELQYALLTQDVDDINAALQSMNKEDGSKYVQLASEIGMIQLQDDEDE